MPSQKVLERDVQKAILRYLELRRVFHWRNNSGAFKPEHGGFIRFGAVGSPDIFAIRNGICWGIEVKGSNGKLSEHQKEFRDKFTLAGGKYIVAHAIDDIMELFN